MSDAWEILVGHSTAGNAWERLGSIIAGNVETVTHAYELGTFTVVDAGATFNSEAGVVTFNIVETLSIDFETISGSIEFAGVGILEVKSC
jgi:hypothetical protein